MEDKMTNLMSRFPNASEDTIEGLLVKHQGHAGQVAARLKNDSLHAVAERAEARAELAKKDPASALLALLQAMQEHASIQCKHGCTVRAKRLCCAVCFECVSPNADYAVSTDEFQHVSAHEPCSVAASLNSELKVLVKLVKQFQAVKENDEPCQNEQLSQQTHSTAASEDSSVDAVQRGLRVRVVGAIGRGLEGTLRNYNSDQRRWSVVLDNGAAYYLRGADLEPVAVLQASSEAVKDEDESHLYQDQQLSEQTCLTAASEDSLSIADTMQSGLRVRVVGAIGRGLEGTLRNYDDDQRRWSVVLDDGASYYLREADLKPVATSQA